MLLGFKPQFVDYVREGSKRHTVRAMRARPFKVGDICDCYGDVRQKTMYLIGRWPCAKVQEIRIGMVLDGMTYRLDISVDGETLSKDEAVAFAWADGFRDGTRGTALDRMGDFWFKEHRLMDALNEPPFFGQLIHWDWS